MSKKINYILFSTLGLGVFSFGAFNLFPSTDEIIAKEKNMISIHKEVTNSSLNNSPISLSTYNTDSIRLNVYEPISDNVTLRNFSQKREFIINDFFMLNVNSKKKSKMVVNQKIHSSKYSEKTFINEINLFIKTDKDVGLNQKLILKYSTDIDGNVLNPSSYLKENSEDEFVKILKNSNPLFNQTNTSLLNNAVSYIEEKNFVIIDELDNKFLIPMKSVKHLFKDGFYQKQIALTFDDGPSIRTIDILDVLKKHNVKATFFVLGDSAEKNQEIILRTSEEGHQIGNHSWIHHNYTTLTKKDLIDDFNKTNDIIESITKKEVTIFRPPYGSYNSSVSELMKKENIEIVLWNVDTLDWNNKSAKQVSKNILDNMKEGNVILMHDLYTTTTEGLDIALKKLKNKGFDFVTIENMY